VTFASAAATAMEGFPVRHDDKLVDAAVRALTSLHAADDELAVMARIVDEAARLCAASFAVLWPYRADARQFDSPVAVNLSPRSQKAIAEREPRTRGTAERLLADRYRAIEDLRCDEVLDPEVRELLLQIGVGSFQAIALRVGTEPLGVLYVDHDQPRRFDDVDRRRLARFALHAALALKAARVLRRVDAAHRRVETLADWESSADLGPMDHLERTFADVATHARDVLECDVVALHVYNASTNTFERPQRLAGDLVDARATNLDPERDSQVARWVMRQPAVVPVEDLERDPVFGPTRFARVESIRSCLALPLRRSSDSDPVGALIANFHDRRCFTGEQLRRSSRCAEHVALAIENALRLRENQLLVPVTSALLGTASLAETLNWITNYAATLLGSKRAGPLVTQVLLQEGAELVVRAIHGSDAERVIGTSCVRGRGSHAGHAAERREPIVVASYETEQRFNPADELGRGFSSGVSVAMLDGKDLIGVLEVRSRNSHQFGGSHGHLLSTLAVQAAMAIKSDLRSVRARRGEGHLQALRKAEESAERVRRGVMSREAVLQDLLRITVECFSLHSVDPTANTFGTLFLVKRGPVRSADMLMLEAVYPLELEPQFAAKFRGGRSVHERPCGITGRTVTSKAKQLVLDLHNDDDYLEVIRGSRSEIAAPIMSCGNVVGALDVESDSPRVFDDRDLETLVTLAGFVATALANLGIEHILRAAHDLAGSTALSHATSHNLLTGIDQLDTHALRGRLKDQVADLGFHGRLAQDIVAAAKVLNQEPLHLTATSLADVVHAVADRLTEAATSKHLALDRTILEQGKIMMQLDEDRMRQVLTNLVANAIKYTHSGGRVEIRVARDATTDRIVVSVIDTGPNPPSAHELHRLFEPYYRAANVHDPHLAGRADVGQGLGLSIARTLVELHGGQIWPELNDRGGLTVAFDLDDWPALDRAHEEGSS
jgi:GAF domain-containing protein/anti-sigma regulatory factor (Ser/Thr protein kinase)